MPLLRVQHHAAHIAAIAAESPRNDTSGPLMGAALDGYGYGDDGGAWGGELMLVAGAGWRRIGHLAPLPLPGGDRAAREIWRMGLAAAARTGHMDIAALRRLAGDDDRARAIVNLALDHATMQTTSLGRLFDAAAAILGLRLEQTEEAQAAMELEALSRAPIPLPGGYRLNGAILDFTPLLGHLLHARPGLAEGADLFHGTVAAGLSEWIALAGRSIGAAEVALAGGCMTNRVLAEDLCRRLSAGGMAPLLPRRAPANDGGLSLGQALLARRAIISGILPSGREWPACVSLFRSG